MSACGLPGDCPYLMKVRLSDGSIGLACFPSDKEPSDGGRKRRHNKQGLIQLETCASRLPGDCVIALTLRKSDCPMDPMDPSDMRVFRWTKNYPMEKK